MDNNLPKEPPNSGNGIPPSFGSNFNPHTNPVDPNNPYAAPPQPPSPDPTPSQPPPPAPNPNPSPQPHPKPHGHILTEEEKHKLSELAKHKPKDIQGHWTKVSNIPPIIEVNQNTEPSDKKDPPLFGLFITNPVTYLKLFLKRLIRRQAITLRIPVLALVIIMVGIGGFGVGFQSGLNWALFRLFPNSSPILHRAITEQGTVLKNKQSLKSSQGSDYNKGEYFLKSDNKKSDSLWTLKSVSANVKLDDYVDQVVQIKGNLTPTPNLIEVSEIISFDTKSDESSPDAESSPISQTTPPVSNASTDTSSNSSTAPTNPNTPVLPALYSNLKWEAPKSKTLTFTSGTRKIEQEVIYIESLQVNTYPQDFISYYTQQLTNSGFKQTLNSQEPNSTSITYSKGNLFLTFGIKNIYSGSGDNKQIVGYKAYIEHN